MKLKLIVLGIFLIISLILAYSVYQNYKIKRYFSEYKAFSSREDCERTTGVKCEYSACDYIPRGKTIQEVCGTRPGKGFYPVK